MGEMSLENHMRDLRRHHNGEVRGILVLVEVLCNKTTNGKQGLSDQCALCPIYKTSLWDDHSMIPFARIISTTDNKRSKNPSLVSLDMS